jgi:ribulose-phosphate 3-epimerase
MLPGGWPADLKFLEAIMLKCSTSLWSADLTNLEKEIRRVEPYSERWHLDVADGHYTPTMLFFPDLVAQIRPLTPLPLEIHLMTTEPLTWIEPFCEAGADVFIFCLDSLTDVGEAIEEVKKRNRQVGISLLLTEGVELLEGYWRELDLVTIGGTAMGVKGASLDPSVPDKIRAASRAIKKAGARTEIQADGGIRHESVPLISAAGANWIVPGSLMFKYEPAEMRRWLAGVAKPSVGTAERELRCEPSL